MDRKKNRIIASALIAAAIVLFVFGILALPENIVMQVASSGEPNRMGKIPGLLIPFAITAVFSVLLILDDMEDKMKKHLGCAVRVTPGVSHANGRHTKGVVEIDFFDNDELDRIIDEIDFQALVSNEMVHSVAEIVLINHEKITEGALQQTLEEVT